MNISDLWPLTSDHWPGTIWLLKEHKLCVEELQKLKSMIEDLHRFSTRCFFLSSVTRIDHIRFRYIDLIHERGQSLFNAYNDLRKRLMDVRNWAKMENIIYMHNYCIYAHCCCCKTFLSQVRREISIIGRRNHDAEQTIKRLRVISLFLMIFLSSSYRRQVEMEDWKTKSNKMTMELNELKAQYKELENKVGYFQEHKEV